MAVEHNIPAKVLFIGEDKRLRFKLYGEDGVTPLDGAAMSFRWTLSDDPEAPDAIVVKTTTAGQIFVEGAFSPVDAENEQYVEVDLRAEDTLPLSKDTYHHALRRADVPSRTVLTFGTVALSAASR